MTHQCEANCGKDLPEDITSDAFFKFFDYRQNKFVVYHKDCYNKKFGSNH